MADEIRIVVRADDQFSGVLGNFGSIITGIESAINLAGDALRFFGDMALQGLDAIASYERMGASLETLVARELLMAGAAEDMTQALAMSSVQAEELLHWTQELAINSPFTAEGVNNAFRMAMAYGFSAEEAQRLTEAMIDFAAGSGASEQVMGQIALALGQIEAKGKLAGQEVLQLVNAGLPVTQILAEAFGVTTAELVKMQQDGLIPAHEAIEAITVYLETNFAGAAERQATTWAGLQGTFADIKTMGLREFFGGMFEVLQPLAIELSNFLQTEGMDRLSDWGAILGQLTSDFIDFGMQLSEVDLSGDFEDIIIRGIEGVDWNRMGYNFSIALNTMFSTSLTTDSGVEEAMGSAFTDFIAGFFGFVNWDELSAVFAEGLEYSFARTFGYINFDQMGNDLRLGFEYVGSQILQGLANSFGYSEWAEFANDFVEGFQLVVSRVKSFLGISSPSTVFAGIGRDIISGLISGWTSAIGNFINTIENSIEDIISIFPDWLQDAIGLDASGLGSAGGGTAPDSGTGTGGTGQVVNNYFYGPVYIGSSLDDANYDCPSPNPLVGASGNQLVVTGY